MRELFSALQQVLEGDLLLPQHAEYEVARRVRNARIDCRPTAIVRCVSVQDIQQSLQLAEIQQLPVALRGGGAHVAGYGTCQDGLVLDLSRMKQIAIDPDKRLVHVALEPPGANWMRQRRRTVWRYPARVIPRSVSPGTPWAAALVTCRASLA